MIAGDPSIPSNQYHLPTVTELLALAADRNKSGLNHPGHLLLSEEFYAYAQRHATLREFFRMAKLEIGNICEFLLLDVLIVSGYMTSKSMVVARKQAHAFFRRTMKERGLDMKGRPSLAPR